MAFIGALERAREEDSRARFLIKGGMACELRFPGRRERPAISTPLFHGELDDLLADLDAAFAETYSGFSFTYSPPEAIRETGAHRFDVTLLRRAALVNTPRRGLTTGGSRARVGAQCRR